MSNRSSIRCKKLTLSYFNEVKNSFNDSSDYSSDDFLNDLLGTFESEVLNLKSGYLREKHVKRDSE